MSELKPCPFCGEYDTEVNTLNNHWLFICSTCGARTYGVTGNPTEEQATKDWNARPFEARAVEVLAHRCHMLTGGDPFYTPWAELSERKKDKRRAEARALLGIKDNNDKEG